MRFAKKLPLLISGMLLLGLMMAPALKAQNSYRPNGAWLGITMEDVTAENRAQYQLQDVQGVIVRSVQPGSPAALAKVQEDDVILEFAGQTVRSAAQLTRLVRETPVGREIKIACSRAGKKITLTATLMDNPNGLARYMDELPAMPFWGESAPRPSPRPKRQERSREEADAGRAQNRPRLGVQLQPLTEQLADFLGVTGKKGALVASVQSDAASAGKLQAGDVIVGVADSTVDSPEDVTRFLRNAGGGEITVKIIRNKKPVSVVITLPEGKNQKNYRL